MITLFGKWIKPAVFITEDGKQMTVYAYQMQIQKINFPVDCFIQLDGNEVKNFLEVVR